MWRCSAVLAVAVLACAAPATDEEKKAAAGINPDSLLPIDYMKVEDVETWLQEKKDSGVLHEDTAPEKFRENSVQGTTLKWLGAMGRGDKQKEELLEKVGCASKACYKKFSQAVTAMYVEQRNAKWNPGSSKKKDGDEEVDIKVTPEEVQKMKVTQLQAFLKKHGINPAAVGKEKSDLRRRALEIVKSGSSGKAEKKEEPKKAAKEPKKEEPKEEPKKEAKKAKKEEKKAEKKVEKKAPPPKEEDDDEEWEECDEDDEDCEEY